MAYDNFGRRGRFGIQQPVSPLMTNYDMEPRVAPATRLAPQPAAAPMMGVSDRYRRDQRRATEDTRNAGFLEARAAKAAAAPINQGPAMQPKFPTAGRPMGEVTPQAPLMPGQFAYGTEQTRERSQQIGRDLADGADPKAMAPVNMTGFASNGGKGGDPNQQWDAQNAAQAQWRQQQVAARGGVPLGVAMPDAGRLNAAAEAKRGNALMTMAPYMSDPSRPQTMCEDLRGQRQFNDASPEMYAAQTGAVNAGSQFVGAQTGMVGAQTRNVDANTQAVQDGSVNWQQERESLLAKLEKMQTQLDRYRQIEMRNAQGGPQGSPVNGGKQDAPIDSALGDTQNRLAYSASQDGKDVDYLQEKIDTLTAAGAKPPKNNYGFTNRETGQQTAGQQPQQQSQQPVQIASDDDYNALPSGAMFIAPDGTTRRKP
jgi:hypothetical protein